MKNGSNRLERMAVKGSILNAACVVSYIRRKKSNAEYQISDKMPLSIIVDEHILILKFNISIFI